MDNHSVAVMIHMMTLIASITSDGEIQQSNCRSPQYLEMGREGVVECSHGQTVYGYYWYDTTDSSRNQPIIRNEDGSKSGRGYAAGEYDIQNDGSLVIKSVSFDHDRVYKLLTAKRQFGETSEEDVTVIVTVRPDEDFPLIDQCSGDVSCFAQLSPQTAMRCIVSNSRPAINLTWSLLTSDGPQDVSFTSRVLPSEQLFTSEASIDEIPFHGNSLLLLECKQKRDELPSLLTETATVLIQNRDLALTIPPGAQTITRYLKEGSSPQLPCVYKENTIAMAWKRVDSGTLAAKTRQRVFKMSEDVRLSPEGFLILPDINLRDEGVYICSTNDGESEYNVVYHVHTYALPVQPHSLIDVCGTRKVCSSVHEAGDVLSCKVEGSRPFVNLTWSIRTSNGDLTMDSEGTVNNQSDGLFSSSETTTFPNLNTSFAVLSCTPYVVGDVFELQESLLLVELVGRRPSFKTPPITKWFERDTDGELSCSDGVYTFWKRRTASANDSVAFAVNGGIYPMNTTDQNERFHMRTHGTLVLNSVLVEDEGIYMCVFGDGFTESATMYDLKVFAVPSPPHLVVEGCEQQSYCVLERPSDGSVVCSVHGIRPEVKLTWTIRSGTENGATFVNHTVVRSINGETYDISLHSYLRAGRTAEKITIQCKAVGPHPELFDLSSTLDVYFTGGVMNGNSNMALFSLLLIPLAITVVSIVIFIKVKCKKRRETSGISGKDEVDWVGEGSSMLDRNDTSMDQQLEDFVLELRNKYSRWCANVHLVPGGGRQQQQSIDQIYVDNGLNVSGSHNQSSAGSLRSYEDLFRLEVKRVLVEADAGYGKSSMVLKAADDWCKLKDGSPLKEVHIFILLQMKSLKDITSFYGAIVKSLLPNDTKFTAPMIERLMKKRKVVVGLDGFDEYPERGKETDFKNILSGDMLQEVQVVLLTRTDCLPTTLDSRTRHFRLSEFSDGARQNYIHKSVEGHQVTAVSELLEKFSVSSIINNLLRVPLFFTMFVHLTNELRSAETIVSTTSLLELFMKIFEKRLKEKEGRDLSMEHIALLSKTALEGVEGEGIAWPKHSLLRRLGEGCFTDFVHIGILVEEEEDENESVIERNLGVTNSTRYVKFTHKIICEWYAARCLVKYLEKSKFVRGYERHLRKLNPFELQYLYKFACGMSPVAAKRIIQYLERGVNGHEFALLCQVEETGQIETITEDIKKICKESVSFFEPSSRLQRASKVQLLEIASQLEIPIKSVFFDRCYAFFEEFPDSLGMQSGGIRIPPLATLKELEIYSPGHKMTKEECNNILTFASKCDALVELRLSKTLQPMVMGGDGLRAIRAKTIGCTLMWLPENDKLTYLLEQDTGKWKFYRKELPIGRDFLETVKNRLEDLDYLDEKYYKGTLEGGRIEKNSDSGSEETDLLNPIKIEVERESTGV